MSFRHLIIVVVVLLVEFFSIGTIVLTSTRSGQVIDKEFIPAHTTTTLFLVGRVLMPRTIEVPDEWYITIEDDFRVSRRSVSAAEFEQIEVGQYREFNRIVEPVQWIKALIGFAMGIASSVIGAVILTDKSNFDYLSDKVIKALVGSMALCIAVILNVYTVTLVV